MTLDEHNLLSRLKAALREALKSVPDEALTLSHMALFDETEAALAAPALPEAFRVGWHIDSDAESPELAAFDAFEALRRPDTTATVFEVLAADGTTHSIDVADMVVGQAMARGR